MVCSVQCSMCSTKYTYSDSGAFAFAGAVPNVHCAVCCLPNIMIYWLKQDESNLSFLIINDFLKFNISIVFNKTVSDYTF